MPECHMRFQKALQYAVKDPGGCLIWAKSRNVDGYGWFWNGSRMVLAHRMAYEIVKGPIPHGFCILHRCDNPPCVNIEHLSLGTQSENIRDRTVKNRSWRSRGELCGNARLTNQQAAEIRIKFIPRFYTREMLAKEYDVSLGTIKNVLSGACYA